METKAIESVKKGELVQLIRVGKPSASFYVVDGYCRQTQRYWVTDWNDVSKGKGLKKGTLVAVGATY